MLQYLYQTHSMYRHESKTVITLLKIKHKLQYSSSTQYYESKIKIRPQILDKIRNISYYPYRQKVMLDS